ncbi:hypothetical protein, partial [Pseudomonas tolaasii]
RFFSRTEVKLSQASQLPQLNIGVLGFFYRQKKAAHRPSAPQKCRQAQQQRFVKSDQSSSANA